MESKTKGGLSKLKKEKMERILKENEGLRVIIENDYEDNGKSDEENKRTLVEGIEAIMFRLGNDETIEWNENTSGIFQWICDVCVTSLHGAGVRNCTIESNAGYSGKYDIKTIYEKYIREDF